MYARGFWISALTLGHLAVAHAAPSAAVTAAAAARHQTRTASPQAMMRLAQQTVTSDIKLHGNLSQKLDAPQVTQVVLGEHSNGKTLNPITGYGTIHVTVKQSAAGKSLLTRILHPFSKYANREFDVAIGKDGHAEVLNSGWSQTLAGRTSRWFRTGPKRLALSIAQNPNAKKIAAGAAITVGAGLLGLATGGTATVGLLGLKLGLAKVFGSSAIAAATMTGQIWEQGRASVKTALADRSAAFDSTVTWAQTQGQGGAFPTLDQAYAHYNDAHKDQSIVRNYTLGGFAEALQSRGL